MILEVDIFNVRKVRILYFLFHQHRFAPRMHLKVELHLLK